MYDILYHTMCKVLKKKKINIGLRCFRTELYCNFVPENSKHGTLEF